MKEYITATYQEKVENLPIILYTMSSGYKQGTLISENGRPFSQILFVISGKGFVIHNGTRYELTAGSAFFTLEHTPIRYESTYNLVTAFITVTGGGIYDLIKHYNITNGFLYKKFISVDKYLAYIKDIISEYFKYKRSGVLSALSYNFFVNFFEGENTEVDEITKISLYIEKNFNKKLTLNAIADLFSISVSKLTHGFKKRYGFTVFEYILNLRLNYAKTLLSLDSNVKIQDVAYLSGFEDVSYFCKAYKKKFKLSPTNDKYWFCKIKSTA